MLYKYRRAYRLLAEIVPVIIFANISGCGGGGGDGIYYPPKPNLVLAGDEKQLAEIVKAQHSFLADLAENLGKSATIQLGAQGELVNLSFARNEAANYSHPRFVRQKTGATINLIWGLKGTIPTVKVTDDSGTVLTINGTILEYPLENTTAIAKQRSATELAVLGAKVAAIAFAVWLGAGVGKAVFAAIGFLAFNAMVIGLLATGVAILAPVAKVSLEFLGIDSWDDVKLIFQSATNDIVQLFKEVMEFLSSM